MSMCTGSNVFVALLKLLVALLELPNLSLELLPELSHDVADGQHNGRVILAHYPPVNGSSKMAVLFEVFPRRVYNVVLEHLLGLVVSHLHHFPPWEVEESVSHRSERLARHRCLRHFESPAQTFVPVVEDVSDLLVSTPGVRELVCVVSIGTEERGLFELVVFGHVLLSLFLTELINAATIPGGQEQKVVGVFQNHVCLEHIVQAQRVLRLVLFAAATADDIADSQSVHLVVVSPEDHFGPVKAIAVVVVETVLEFFFVHSPEVDGMGSNDDHEAGYGFVAEGQFVQDAGVRVHSWRIEQAHDVLESKRSSALSYMVSPFSFLLDAS